MANAAVHSKAVVLLLLLIYCLINFPLLVGDLFLSLFCYALLCVHFSFAIILKRKRKLVALLLLSYRCIVTIDVLWLLLKVPWVGLQCEIVVFPAHTHLLFENREVFAIDHIIQLYKISALSQTRSIFQILTCLVCALWAHVPYL